VLRAREGDANVQRVAVTLPHTEFLAQNHIGDVCTRPRFAAEQCPAASVYGKAVAYTPLFDTPLRGNVYLRSSDNLLPDLVADMHSGAIRIELEGRIESVRGGRIKVSFDGLPDAPLDRFVLQMLGGKKGLLVNSADLCTTAARATARLVGQNNRGAVLQPRLTTRCRKHRRRHHHRGHHEKNGKGG
jgi:hypothetical protein